MMSKICDSGSLPMCKRHVTYGRKDHHDLWWRASDAGRKMSQDVARVRPRWVGYLETFR